MFQFYNDNVKKNVAKVTNELDNIEIKLSEFIYLTFLNYVKTNEIMGYNEFKNKLTIDFEEYKKQVDNTLTEQRELNKQKFKEQMEAHDIEPRYQLEDIELDISNGLQAINDALTLECYQKYQILISTFRGQNAI